jgi:glycosyltransferase involved in cell wall biosynthesis
MIGRYATDVLGDSEECTQTFVPESWIRGERATVYCSVNPQKLFAPRTKTEVRKVLGLPTSSLIVGHVGRLAKVKNHEKILAVFREIAFRQPDACMLCVGDGPEQSRLKKFCAEEGLKNVYWVGAQSEVSQYLRAMDVFLFPSHWEGLSIALLEAQLSGLPCVVSAHLTKEAVIEGSTVRFVALKESNQHWASVVIEEAKNNRCDLAAVASRFSRSRFSPETCVQSLSKIYRRLQPPR